MKDMRKEYSVKLKLFLSNSVDKDNKKIVSNELDPLVSIIMPSFNQGNFIERSILSVLNQSYKKIELIIIDAKSTDSTASVLKKYNNHIAYTVSEKDNGQSEALNKGFRVAKGEIYGWLNADDLLYPDTIQTVVNKLKENPQKEIVFGDYFDIDKNDNVISYNFAFNFNTSHFVYEGFHINAQASFWRSSLHEKFGDIDETLYRTMDYDMLLRFGLICGQDRFLRIDKPLACFRRHESQKTQGADDTVLREHKYIANKLNFHDKYTLKGDLKRGIYRIRRAMWYLRRGGLLYLFQMVKKMFKSE